jgi:hypothetical protein
MGVRSAGIRDSGTAGAREMFNLSIQRVGTGWRVMQLRRAGSALDGWNGRDRDESGMYVGRTVRTSTCVDASCNASTAGGERQN